MSAVSIEQALTDPALLGAALGPPETWSTWLAVLKACFGLDLNRAERRAFEAIAGSRKPPERKVQELWVLAGRGSGKSCIAAAVSVFIACFVQHDLDPGETGCVLTLAASRDQAAIVFNYCLAFMRNSPILASMIKSTTAHEIRLTNNVVISIHSNSYRLIRGRSLLAVVCDEIAFWRDELSANPDLEIYRAVKPALARHTNSLLVGISTPFRRGGLLFARHRDFYDTDDDDVLVVRGATSAFNPTIDQAVIAKQMRDDPEGGAAEWLAEFRSDISALFDDAVIEDAIDFARPLELPPRGQRQYFAFADASAGRHDAFSAVVGHLEGDKGEERFVADVVRGRLPPFNPNAVAEEYAQLARTYGCPKIIGDAFAGEWVAAAFAAAGVKYETSPLNKSQLYLESLPSFNQGHVSIPNHERLVRELRGLERRVHRSGQGFRRSRGAWLR